MEVHINGDTVNINSEVFEALLGNSVARTYVAYERAIQSDSITWSDLEDLATKGDIPSSLFFAPLPLVETQINTKLAKLLAGVSKQTFSVNSRETVELRDIELIVKDLLRKQEFLKRHDPTLTKNQVSGMLSCQESTAEDDAARLMDALSLTHADIRSATNKTAAVELLIERLEDRQILVSRSVQNFMPQRLTVKFSGLSIKDAKVPYIFICGGDQGDAQEPAGRQLFTLALMSVLVARGIFSPMTYDGASTRVHAPRAYDTAGSMLMPRSELLERDLNSLLAVKEAADALKVTPSAIAVRAMRLEIIGQEVANDHLDQLRLEFAARPKPVARQPKTVKAIRKYNGRAFSRRMLDAHDAGRLTSGEFCRVVCLRRIEPDQIDDFREALR